jgi:hypothetical protein
VGHCTFDGYGKIYAFEAEHGKAKEKVERVQAKRRVSGLHLKLREAIASD